MTRFRFINGHVATADGVLPGAEIVVQGDRIASIGAVEGVGQNGGDTIDLNGGWVVPGYIDTQVNGGGGVLFNDRLDVDGIATMAAAHAAYGTTAMLPTLVSETPDKIARALDAIDEAIAAGVPGIVGIHVEGPVLNPARKGIHDPTRFRDLDDDMVAVLTRPRRGKVMLTIAPERVPVATIERLVAAGVLVSAGHSEASYEQAMAAFDVGLSGITHLYNAMPAMQQRVPGLAGATLDDPRPYSGLIIDGFHVSAPMLRLALKARPFDKLMLVTDAMSSVGAVQKDFVLHGRHIDVSGGKCAYADGTLAGSDLDMGSAVANAVEQLRITVDRAAAMAATNPAAFLGLSHERGSLAPGLRADWVVLDAVLKPVETRIAKPERIAA
ncbi:N-acetylglucosamine-6-phosphate deacetylase [Sphingomonas sp. SORGH_AS_0879]|uniref:N-acetylglucosamine-6-phosphate deacetylase n=1 Tax=Sphingomonas sp. SORGH_AS_0879 TaxID=3041790 RepID=UPI00278477E0|nr:N-acetylglucosamine-6-phosphate deacetylase [Sphingomonas sp. SORGH_AS_0879]MDQ1230334.1 N-acetylglucosamine-6-phosphate deacetylase [Sphingomonas sp. SORGH_AS_0879]